MGMPEDVGLYLVSKSRVTALGTDYFINWLPESPDIAVVLTETSAPAPEYTLGGENNPAVLQYGLQVRVRGTITGAQAARTLIENVWRDLDIVDRTLSSTRYYRIAPTGGPMYLGRDANERPEFTANFIGEVAV